MVNDLADAYAVVVGCEDYPMDRWALNGPAYDALDFGTWLLRIGMPAKNLHFLASPLPQNQAAFNAAVTALGEVVFHGGATSGMVKEIIKSRILKAIKADGSLKRAGQLLLFWSGHGIVQRHQTGFDRIVFCTDVAPNAMECISIPAIADWLSSELPSFQLIFLVDACASESSRLGVDTRLSFVGLPPGVAHATPNRFFAYAAYPGQVARNQSGNQRGLFTSALLNHLSGFRPTNLLEFREIDRVVNLACDTVNAASAGRQSVVWDLVDWKGNRGRVVSDEAAWHELDQAPLSESAALLCNRKRQWREFERLAKSHQKQHPGRPMLVITHGQRNQDSSAFLSNLSHRVRESRLWAGSLSTIDRILTLDHWSDLSQEELDEHVTSRLGTLLQVAAKSQPADLAARISARCSTWMLMTPVESQLLRKDPCKALAPLLRFWQTFPDINDSALIILIHIEYPPPRTSLIPQFLSKLMHPDRVVREAIARQVFCTASGAPVVSLPTELGMVTVDDVATEIHSIHRSWGRPTERQIQTLFEPDEQRAMDEVVKQLAFFIQKGQFDVSSQAC
jgi:hypothetical protein